MNIILILLILNCKNIQFTQNYKDSSKEISEKDLELLSESDTINHIKNLSDRDLK